MNNRDVGHLPNSTSSGAQEHVGSDPWCAELATEFKLFLQERGKTHSPTRPSERQPGSDSDSYQYDGFPNGKGPMSTTEIATQDNMVTQDGIPLPGSRSAQTANRDDMYVAGKDGSPGKVYSWDPDAVNAAGTKGSYRISGIEDKDGNMLWLTSHGYEMVNDDRTVDPEKVAHGAKPRGLVSETDKDFERPKVKNAPGGNVEKPPVVSKPPVTHVPGGEVHIPKGEVPTPPVVSKPPVTHVPGGEVHIPKGEVHTPPGMSKPPVLGHVPGGKVDKPPVVSKPAPGNKNATLGAHAPPAIQRWKKEIEKAAAATGLPANYIAATMWAESRGNPKDSSHNPEDHSRVDYGLMQISQETAREIGAGYLNVRVPADNVMAGAMELKDKFKKAHGSYEQTSAAYVGTGNRQYVKDVMEFWHDLDNGHTLRD